MTHYHPDIENALPSKVAERVRYFPRQLITADDMRAEQEYFRDRLRGHNRYLHGWGVVCGCEIKLNVDNDHAWGVRVDCGYLITPGGDEVQITQAADFDLATEVRRPADPCAHRSPCAPASAAPTNKRANVHLAVCYAECNMRPVRIHPAGCGCDDAACEYSRVRDSFELIRLAEADLPKSHQGAARADKARHEAFQAWKAGDTSKPVPVPACPAAADNNYVVLATLTLPLKRTTAMVPVDINYDQRRALYSTAALQGLLTGVA